MEWLPRSRQARSSGRQGFDTACEFLPFERGQAGPIWRVAEPLHRFRDQSHTETAPVVADPLETYPQAADHPVRGGGRFAGFERRVLPVGL
jgi:hypothetical protein